MNSTRAFCRSRWRVGRLTVCRSCQRTLATTSTGTQTATPSTGTQTAATQAEIDGARTYCLDLLRRYDSPSFTLQTFIPLSARDAYLAIRAFNIDISRIADATSNPTVGAMRMQFWRDAITRALSNTPPKEPVAILLSHAASTLSARTKGHSRLSKTWFHRLIAERERNLSNPPFPSLAALETYAENTYSMLSYLTLQALPVASVTADHLASHIGKATGIATVLRGLPLIAFPPPANHHSKQGGALPGGRQGAVLLPLDVMAEAGVKEEEVLRRGADAPGLRDAVFAVATRANDHLITARAMLASLSAGNDVDHAFEHAHEEGHGYSAQQLDAGPERGSSDVDKAFGVLVHAVSTRLWLERLQKLDFDVFNPKLRTTDWRLPWKAYWAYKRKMI